LLGVTLGKVFVECFLDFAECFRHSAKKLISVVKVDRGAVRFKLKSTVKTDAAVIYRNKNTVKNSRSRYRFKPSQHIVLLPTDCIALLG
jgi:hypothetical protein